MARLIFSLLGTPEIKLNGETVETDRRKAVALFAYLAITTETHSRESLATFFWPDSDRTRGLAYLRRTLWELNQMVGDGWLTVSRETIAFESHEDCQLDVALFLRLAGSEQQADWETAVSLYRDTFMAGFTLRDSADFDRWQERQATDLQQRLSLLLQRLVAIYIEQEAWEKGVQAARRWADLDPLHEPAQRALMQLYTLRGDKMAAIRQYEQLVDQLQMELDVVPEPETITLYEAIRTGKLRQKTAVSSPLSPSPAPKMKLGSKSVLPASTSPFVGRKTLLATLNGLLADPACRLLTLVAPGGMGKTRLAIELATQQQPHFQDGVYFVSLAPLGSPAALISTLARVLSFSFVERREGEPEEMRGQLLEFLRDKQLLLVLDNYEHLLEKSEMALLPLDILREAAEVKIVVTSRVPLNMRGETVQRLDGLRYPEWETAVVAEPSAWLSYSAVQLFVQTAQRMRPTFTLDEQIFAEIVQICALTQGMPLALELAASWIEMLSPAEIRAEIAANLDFLATELRDVPERQQSIRAVFESTWRQLSERERDVFPRLSLFRGGFSREAVEVVAEASLRTLKGLVNKSLLRVDENGRYQVHVLLQQYAQERLEADPEWFAETISRHAHYYAHWLIERGSWMVDNRQRAAFNLVDQELDNIRKAWEWLLHTRNDDLLEKLLRPLYTYGRARQMSFPLRDWFALGVKQLEAEPAHPLLLLKLMICHIVFLSIYNGQQRAQKERLIADAWKLTHEQNLEQALGLWYMVLSLSYSWFFEVEQGRDGLLAAYQFAKVAEDVDAEAIAAHFLGETYQRLGQIAAAEQWYTTASRILSARGNNLQLAYLQNDLAFLMTHRHQYLEAMASLQNAQQLMIKLDNPLGAAFMVNDMGHVADSAGNYGQALSFFREATGLFRAIGEKVKAIGSLSFESISLTRWGDLAEAQTLRQQVLDAYQGEHDSYGLAWSHWEMGDILRIQGQSFEAAHWYARARTQFEKMDYLLGLAFCERGNGLLALAAGEAKTADFHFAQSVDYARQQGDPWPLTLGLGLWGQAAVSLGDAVRANDLLGESLFGAYRVGNRGLMMVALAGIADLWRLEGKRIEAGILATFVGTYHASWYETMQRGTAVLQRILPHLTDEEKTAVRHQGLTQKLDDFIEPIIAHYDKKGDLPSAICGIGFRINI